MSEIHPAIIEFIKGTRDCNPLDSNCQILNGNTPYEANIEILMNICRSCCQICNKVNCERRVAHAEKS